MYPEKMRPPNPLFAIAIKEYFIEERKSGPACCNLAHSSPRPAVRLFIFSQDALTMIHLRGYGARSSAICVPPAVHCLQIG
jgi:hypothetical protein